MISLSDVNQKRWLKACKKLGLEVYVSSGKGSHAIVKGGNRSERPLTIPNHTYPVLSKKIYKRLQSWGFSEQEINNALS